METYNLTAFGRQLNDKPMSYDKAVDYKLNVMMNYGYEPEIVPVLCCGVAFKKECEIKK